MSKSKYFWVDVFSNIKNNKDVKMMGIIHSTIT